MFPFCDSPSPSPMDMPLYQQMQLSPPSPPKPDQCLFYYPCSPPSFAAFSPLGGGYTIGSPGGLPVMHPFMDQPAPAPRVDSAGNAQGVAGAVAVDAMAAAAAARKDRHSKICTAGGMRDRRMRLSLDVARKFFALQDMLGFDKASKTVQWLLNMSKAAIREIMADDQASSGCEEDGSSSLSVDAKHNPAEPAARGEHRHHKGGVFPNDSVADGKKPAATKTRKAAATPKPPRNAHPVPDKESRAKARERARERTREKNRMRWVTLASAFNVEAASAAARTKVNKSSSSPSSNINLNHSSSTDPAAELEERTSSSTLIHSNGSGGAASRMLHQESSPASDDVIMGGAAAFAANGGGGYGADSSSYGYPEQWELGGVVFANNARLY